jgi:UDP-3-O-[3-hydroxymyristoyl] N-acetylglucosamine deacetylase
MVQKTIKNVVSWQGIGVHSGCFAAVELRPAVGNAGIKIFGQGQDGFIAIGSVVPEAAMHATVIRHSAGWFVSTIEHLMAALYVLQVDNVDVHIVGGEVPILDGSAMPFIQGIIRAGIIDQPVYKRRFIAPKEPIHLQDESGRSIYCANNLASNDLFVDYMAEFDHPLIGKWHYSGTFEQADYVDNVAGARTFGFAEQLPFLRKHGLAKGASLGNSVVIAESGIINDLRIDDECARHKLLDFIGDIALLGAPLVGIIKATKTGHSFNRLLIKHYVENPNLWIEIF